MRYVVLCLLCHAGILRAEEKSPWSSPERARYIHKLMKSTRGVPDRISVKILKEFSRYNKGLCRSTIPGLKNQCLIKAMSKSCKRKLTSSPYCLDVSDLMIVNKLSLNRFLSHRERFQLLKKSDSYSKSLGRALQEKYASLAMEFRLSKGCQEFFKPCFASRIDKFYLKYSDDGRLPWQSCVGALVWFIGTS